LGESRSRRPYFTNRVYGEDGHRRWISIEARIAAANAAPTYASIKSLQAQASVLSYFDVLGMLAIFCARMVPMPLLLQKTPKGMQASAYKFHTIGK